MELQLRYDVREDAFPLPQYGIAQQDVQRFHN
jgi:hypothetical protein